jgi:hypothetical protein
MALHVQKITIAVVPQNKMSHITSMDLPTLYENNVWNIYLQLSDIGTVYEFADTKM